jgi:hypothetical protein
VAIAARHWISLGTAGSAFRFFTMHVYIDESGSFVRSESDATGVCLVGALTLPESRLQWIEKKYAKIRPGLPKEKGEVKGRLLNEDQVARVVDLLRRNDAILELTGIDANLHERDDIDAHRRGQADGMTSGLTDAHHENARGFAVGLADRIRALNDQLYMQGAAMFQAVRETCEHAINYYAQRQPRELAAFYWTIDAKDRDRTTAWEILWADMVLPVLQTRSIGEPHTTLEGADYSHFKRFEAPLPDWLPRPEGDHEPTGTNIRLLLMEHFRRSPDAEPGLELVDIVTNAARRALSGTLQIEGWSELPALMIHRHEHYINLIALHDRAPPKPPPYARIMLRHFTRGGRSMLAPRFL